MNFSEDNRNDDIYPNHDHGSIWPLYSLDLLLEHEFKQS